MSEKLWIILLVLFCAFLASFGQIFFKWGSKTFEFSLKAIFTNYKVIAGAVLYGTSALLFVYSLKHGPLSILYPVIATSYIWVLILSYFLFGEAITLLKVTGVSLIIIGITLISFGWG